jgi:hypothetical protein
LTDKKYSDEDFEEDRIWIEKTASEMAGKVCGWRWSQYFQDVKQEAVIAMWSAAKDNKSREVQANAAKWGQLFLASLKKPSHSLNS